MASSTNGKLPEPKDIVMLAHAELAPHLIDLDSFVTLCYARLDMSQRSLAIWSIAGTPASFTGTPGRAGARCCTETTCRWECGKARSTIRSRLAFEPGTCCCFFSDGITEARNPAGELFGAERLEEYVRVNGALDPGALVEGIRKAVSAFPESERLADDLTSVAIRVEERQLPLARAEIEIR